MKKLVGYFIALSLLFSLTITGCDKKVDSEYIPQCSGVTGGTMEARNSSCKSCCRSNGWDNGTYWDVGQIGCECHGN